MTKTRNMTWGEVYNAIKNLPSGKIWGIPRGGAIVAGIASGMRKDIEVLPSWEGADYIVDDIMESGVTAQTWVMKTKKSVLPLFRKVREEKKDAMWIVFPWEGEDETRGAEDDIRRIIQRYDNSTREGLVDTPRRVRVALDRLLGGYREDPRVHLKTAFVDGACDEMVILKGVQFYSMCEHHLLPFFGTISVGYVPDGKVIGISKIARVIEGYSRRLQLQERLTSEIADAIVGAVGPKGVIVYTTAKHLCLSSRGVEKEAEMMTTAIRGVFNNLEARTEFFSSIKS